MAYAISICAVAAFVILYLLTRRPSKPIYCSFLDDAEYGRAAGKLVRSLPLPSMRSGATCEASLWSIKRDIRFLKRRGKYDALLVGKDKLKQLASTPSLSGMPSVDGVPRAVLLARFCLENSGFDADPDRIRELIEAHNRWRTLCYAEIAGMRDAFKFVLLEELASLYEKLRAYAKCADIAARYVSYPAGLNKSYKPYVGSRLFLSLCAVAAGYKEEIYSELCASRLGALASELERICASADKLDKMDFSTLYSPLEIYSKYDVFACAEAGAKHNFLTLAGELSDRENLDEFLLAIRVDRYMQSASSGHMSLKRFKLAGRALVCISQRRDLTMLATALSFHHFMDIYFRPANRRFFNRSITKILEYENTFEPIYKFRTVNFGISTKDGMLRLSPRLPRGVVSADVAFRYGATQHSLHLRRGEQSALFVGGTRINGVSALPLSDRPLDVTLIIPPED